jgi:3D (Asp-Asp-Asp) domain-containing protein
VKNSIFDHRRLPDRRLIAVDPLCFFLNTTLSVPSSSFGVVAVDTELDDPLTLSPLSSS